MFLEIIITAISAFFIGGFLTFRYNYNHLFAENVSKNRMEWINNFREEVSTIIAATEALCSLSGDGERADNAGQKSELECEWIYHAEKARAKLRTRLNMDITRYGNEYNQRMDNRLKTLRFDGSEHERQSVEEIIELSRKILEHEWKKVKSEAKGKGE